MHRLMMTLARVTAVIGGLVLVALIVMTTLSIIGRSLNDLLHTDTASGLLGGYAQTLIDLGVGEIKGNYELLEAGVAFAIFSFFPICQLYGAHATVDIFTSALPERLNRSIIAFWEIVLTATLILISWRLFEGMQRYIGNGETTFFLQFPVWWGYAASFVASVVTCVVAVYCACLRVVELARRRSILPTEQGH
ncbi:TRAP transporter small permease [Sulfitobacter sabulilitoris]|uniref:TRAP transporter small permease protein n=1 Tax=Sulfitobacter sabulilitoris TaxID=2562655 RepID=A0A5S3PFT0_9RHOB|nr:TRAP transporter small permease [Sulfitobacter sabulilitoris]TMM52914.1 TRAP transporter small permease [Sulfitobacter sabulilitoris]